MSASSQPAEANIIDEVHIDRSDGVLSIQLNRPTKLNAMTRVMHDVILRTLEQAGNESEPPVLVLSGAGRAFSAGDDLKTTGRSVPERWRMRQVGGAPVVLQAVTRGIRDYPGPTVALMHGYTVGAGWDYATSCDVRIATRDCRIGDLRVLRALWAAEGWTYKAPKLMDLSSTYRIGPTGDMVTGEEAYRLGLVHVLANDDQELGVQGDRVVARLSMVPTRNYRKAKARLANGLDRTLDAHLNAIEW